MCSGAAQHSTSDDRVSLQRLHQQVYHAVGYGGLSTGDHDVVPKPHQLQCVPDRLDGNDPTTEQVLYNNPGVGWWGG